MRELTGKQIYKICNRYQLALTHWGILNAIQEHGECSTVFLMGELNKGDSRIRTACKQLMEIGLIEKTVVGMRGGSRNSPNKPPSPINTFKFTQLVAA